jgi:hypothetical protein
MPKVITEGSTFVCPHQAPITFIASQHSLKVGDNYVLVAGDVSTGSVSGVCPNQPTPATPNNVPCTKVVSLLAGAATIFTVGEQPVLLETATGLTDALPPGSWQVQSAGQTKLDVV